MTLATVERLRDGRDIAATLRSRNQRAGRYVAAHIVARDDHGPARLAIVASRRVGGAVARNRAKRLIREAARTIDWRPGIDVVVVARRACADSRTASVREDLARIADLLDASTEAS